MEKIGKNSINKNMGSSTAGNASANNGVFIVIPAYNEEKSIAGVIGSLAEEGYSNVIVVDDGSKDSTSAAAERTCATVLRHIINRGQGAALQTGISHALEEGAEIIVTFDADGQHDAKEIKNLTAPIRKNEADAVLGSRFLSGNTSNIPVLKKIILKGGVVFTWIFSGKKLTDTHNGFRAFSRKAAQGIAIKHDGMEHASEIIDQICRKKISFREVPVTIKYSDYSRKKGQSAFNSFRIVFRLLMRKLMN